MFLLNPIFEFEILALNEPFHTTQSHRASYTVSQQQATVNQFNWIRERASTVNDFVHHFKLSILNLCLVFYWLKVSRKKEIRKIRRNIHRHQFQMTILYIFSIFLSLCWQVRLEVRASVKHCLDSSFSSKGSEKCTANSFLFRLIRYITLSNS